MTKEERDDLIVNNRGLVHMAVNKLWTNPRVRNWYFDFEEAVQTGMVALCKAADHFDPTRGFKFSTYATTAVINYVLRSARASKDHHATRDVFITNETDYCRFQDNKGIDGLSQEYNLAVSVPDEMGEFGTKDIEDSEEAAFFIARVSISHQGIVSDCIMRGKSFKEKAKELNCTPQNIQSKIKTAIKQMQGVHASQFKYLTYQGETKTRQEWSEITGTPLRTIYGRCQAGWSAERIITTPPDKSKTEKRMTPEMLDRIMEMNSQGVSKREIAEEMKMSKSHICDTIRKQLKMKEQKV